MQLEISSATRLGEVWELTSFCLPWGEHCLLRGLNSEPGEIMREEYHTQVLSTILVSQNKLTEAIKMIVSIIIGDSENSRKSNRLGVVRKGDRVNRTIKMSCIGTPVE